MCHVQPIGEKQKEREEFDDATLDLAFVRGACLVALGYRENPPEEVGFAVIDES